MKFVAWIGSLLILASLLGCDPSLSTAQINTTNSSTAKQESSENPTVSPTVVEVFSQSNVTTTPPATTEPPTIGYTQQQGDGNRVVAGQGQFPAVAPIDIPLFAKATWVVAVPWEDGSLWVVALENGEVLGFQIKTEGWQPVEISPPALEAGQPPLLLGDAESPSLLISPSILASSLTHAILLHQNGLSQAFIDTQGSLNIIDENLRQFAKLDINTIPDARILSDENGRLLLLTGSTAKYDHGVLGDATEAGSITRIDDPTTSEVSVVISLPGDLVIEGIAPIWADLNGDGVREVIVTVSNAQQGAQILVFDEEGQQVAAGPAIGQGYRWRHQIAVAPFGPGGEWELVDVLTPHLSGVVEFYRWEGDQLKVVAQLPGYTSHVIGTRNLDMAAAGDFDGDGSVELLLPNQALSELGAVRRTHSDTGAEVVWSLPLDGQMTTNLGTVTLPDGNIAIGIGQENGILLSAGYSLRIWYP